MRIVVVFIILLSVMWGLTAMVPAHNMMVKDGVERCKTVAQGILSESGVITVERQEATIKTLTEALATHKDSVFEKGVSSSRLKSHYSEGGYSVQVAVDLTRSLSGHKSTIHCTLDYSGVGLVKLRSVVVDNEETKHQLPSTLKRVAAADFKKEKINLLSKARYAGEYWLGLKTPF